MYDLLIVMLAGWPAAQGVAACACLSVFPISHPQYSFRRVPLAPYEYSPVMTVVVVDPGDGIPSTHHSLLNFASSVFNSLFSPRRPSFSCWSSLTFFVSPLTSPVSPLFLLVSRRLSLRWSAIISLCLSLTLYRKLSLLRRPITSFTNWSGVIFSMSTYSSCREAPFVGNSVLLAAVGILVFP